MCRFIKPPQLNLTDEERIYAIRSPLWIGYTAAQAVMKRLDVLIKHPPKNRMPNMLLVGDTNNGKTTIINRFRNNHPGKTVESEEMVTLPVLLVEAPPVPSEIRLYDKILEKLYAPYKMRESADKKFFQVTTILKRLETKILILDEIHNIIAVNKSKQRQFLNTIKHLSNELKIPIVGAGVQEAFNAIQSDPQLLNRFTPYILPRWRMNQEFLRLLASFEQMLPLKEQSNLTSPPIANKILGLSEGTIGEISAVITEAAVTAIEKKTEKITIEVLEKIDYITPSERSSRKTAV